MKNNQTSPPQVDSEGRRFLLFHAGHPVYEGDERHQMLERCRKDFGGDLLKMVQWDIDELKKLL